MCKTIFNFMDKLTKIYEGKNSDIYKGMVAGYNNELIIKVLRDDFPSEEKVTKFNNEYEFTHNLNIKGIRKAIKIDRLEGKNALYLEYFEGDELKIHNFDNISHFRNIAVKLVKILGEIHKNHLIHKDLTPQNILINKDNEIKIIDFGISSKYSYKTENLTNTQNLEGTLAYISPEQTGRMNRTIDYRTDYYSLGIIFYEMLTGQLPFKYTDTLQMVHAHIAILPKPPHEINKRIPKALSEVILKLLSKNVEDRYQSAYGLEHDIEFASKINPDSPKKFTLGKKDYSGRLLLKEKLYGRDEENKLLLNSFKEVQRGSSKLVLVKGEAGTGKSVYVHEIHKPITLSKGIYIEGKFDKVLKDIPYFALLQAFKNLALIILNEPEEKFNFWKYSIQKSLGNVGKILTNLIPEYELIIGEQPEMPRLDGEQARNRFKFLWLNFIKSISTKEHPLVLFIDDMQWADNASLELLNNILTDPEINYFLCITAFRDNEIDINHPFSLFIETVKDKEVSIEKINLKSLSENNITELLSDAFAGNKKLEDDYIAEIKKLSGLIYSKTRGNAFFTVQFIKTLFEQELLKYSFEKSLWSWDINTINEQKITDNIATLLANKVKKLPRDTQNILKIAACIGGSFDYKIVAPVAKLLDIIKNESQIHSTIEPAVAEELIITTGNSNYKFVHDRIQQTIYTGITSEKLNFVHYKIGELLLKKYAQNPDDSDLTIFDVVHQINFGIELVEEKEKKEKFIKLNILAGNKAKKSSAYQAALNYFKTAKRLLPENSWVNNYNTTLTVFENLAELNYLTGNYVETEKLVNSVVSKTKNVYDNINVFYTLINSFSSQTRYEEAVKTGIKILSEFNIKIPINPGKIYVAKEYIGTLLAVGNKSVETLSNLPEMTDKKMLSVIKIIESLTSSSYLAYPDLFPVLIFKGIKMMMKYGNCVNSPYIYSAFAVVLVIMNKIERAVEFGELAKKMLTRFDAEQQRAKVTYILNYFLFVWKNPLDDILTEMHNAYKIGTEVGDIEYAGYGIVSLVMDFNHNMELNRLFKRTLSNIVALEKLNQTLSLKSNYMWLQFYDNFINRKEVAHTIDGKYFNEKTEIQTFYNNKNFNLYSTAYTLKLNLAYTYNQLENIEEYIKQAESHEDAIQGSYQYALGVYYYAYGVIKLYQKSNKNKYLKKLKGYLNELKVWTKHNPESFSHKYNFIKAEQNRALGNNEKAGILYNKAIFESEKNQFAEESAFILFTTARFYEEIGQKSLVEFYIKKSYLEYKKWGAAGVCNYIEENYRSTILQFDSSYTRTIQSTTTHTSSTEKSQEASIEIETILKASQTFSGEVKLDNLLKSIMNIIIENAGADFGIIISRNNNDFTIEAEYKHGVENVNVLQSEAIEDSNKIPLTVIKYVIRTKKGIVLDDASEDKTYGKDKYIIANNTKSLICHPIINKDKLTAILYLENNISSGAFTVQRLKTINMLSSQIAISIENASLYENLESKVVERTAELQMAKDKIEEIYKHTTDSINYASRIQNAVLPDYKMFKNYFAEHFILFRPRDIVSGDFYWAKKVGKYFIYSVADCTGHGVPGAFVSMLGISLLNEIISRKQITKASQVLDVLRDELKKSLQQEANSLQKDGMDISLCVLNTETNELQFSGAYNNLYIIRNKELIVYKADRQPIGIYSKEKPFTNTKIQVQKDDCLYIFSDGYVDQFNDKHMEKFKITRFKKLLLEIHEKPMREQNTILNNAFDNWRGTYGQIDDVLIIGVRV